MSTRNDFIEKQKAVINEKIQACDKGIEENKGGSDYEHTTRQRFMSERTPLKDALIRIEQGTYGFCGCGRKISEGRLLAAPAARTCMKCNGGI